MAEQDPAQELNDKVDAIVISIPPGESIDSLFDSLNPVVPTVKCKTLIGHLSATPRICTIDKYTEEMRQKATENGCEFNGFGAMVNIGGGATRWTIDYETQAFVMEIPKPNISLTPQFKPLEKDKV